MLIPGDPFSPLRLIDATLKFFPHSLQILRPRHLSTNTLSGSLRLTTNSISKIEKLLTACLTVRGNPSSINPDSPLASPASSLFDSKLSIISSETNFPWFTISASCLERGPDELSSSRTRSPVAMCGTPRRVDSRLA
nr:hypothetical protein Iba_chr12bCG7980 [Ipomoea batatas]